MIQVIERKTVRLRDVVKTYDEVKSYVDHDIPFYAFEIDKESVKQWELATLKLIYLGVVQREVVAVLADSVVVAVTGCDWNDLMACKCKRSDVTVISPIAFDYVDCLYRTKYLTTPVSNFWTGEGLPILISKFRKV